MKKTKLISLLFFLLYQYGALAQEGITTIPSLVGLDDIKEWGCYYEYTSKSGESRQSLALFQSGNVINVNELVYTVITCKKEDANSSTNTRLGNSPEWLLTITQSDTGRTVYESAVSEKSKTVGIKGWDSGIYIATAQVGAQYISCKFAVPK